MTKEEQEHYEKLAKHYDRGQKMTREKAIRILQTKKAQPGTDYQLAEVYGLAIQALEQEPSGDLISRQATLEPYKVLNDTDTLCVALIRANIMQQPPVNPQPKTGHWIGIDEEPHEDYECNNCGYTISTYTANIEPHTEYKYCPNCGARMESEDKE